MLFRNPRAFAFTMIAVGLGLLLYYGEQWYRLPTWTEAEIEQSVALNVAIELKRMGPHLQPTDEKLERLQEMIRAEIEARIRQERRELERWMGLGLILIVLGVTQRVAQALRQRSP